MSKHAPSWALAAALAAALASPAGADPQPDDQAAPPPAPDGAIHLQATDVFQHHPAFRSPYEGTNSLKGEAESANTVDASLIAGLRPWSGAQMWFDLDMNQGFAPSNT